MSDIIDKLRMPEPSGYACLECRFLLLIRVVSCLLSIQSFFFLFVLFSFSLPTIIIRTLTQKTNLFFFSLSLIDIKIYVLYCWGFTHFSGGPQLFSRQTFYYFYSYCISIIQYQRIQLITLESCVATDRYKRAILENAAAPRRFFPRSHCVAEEFHFQCSN